MIRQLQKNVLQLFVAAFVLYAILTRPAISGHVAVAVVDSALQFAEAVGTFFDAILSGG